MLDPLEIHQALADRVSTVPGARGYALHPGQVVTAIDGDTAIVVEPDTQYIAYHDSFSGSDGALCDMKVRLRFYVQTNHAESAQRRLLEFLSSGTGAARSVIDAIEEDRTLGGAVDDCLIRVAENIAVEDRTPPNVDQRVYYLTADLPVQIWTRRD